MKIKTSEATPRQLNLLVAQIEHPGSRCKVIDDDICVWLKGWGEENDYPLICRYSTDWVQGGPIIEREGINLNLMQFDSPPYWTAHIRHTDKVRFGSFGPTPLIAAMRCYAASKLGDEVEIPNELIGE